MFARVILMKYPTENAIAHRAKIRSARPGRILRCVRDSDIFDRETAGAKKTSEAYVRIPVDLIHSILTSQRWRPAAYLVARQCNMVIMTEHI
jgi:hypothetical protein